MDETRKCVFYPGQSITDLSSPIKLAKFRCVIYLKINTSNYMALSAITDQLHDQDLKLL